MTALNSICARKEFGHLAAFSASDRGDPWAGGLADLAMPGLAQVDLTGPDAGLVEGTMIATEHGWTAVENLRPGDRVVTFDNGLQPLRRLNKSTLWTAQTGAPRATWPLSVPARALGNRSDMLLMPHQAVLIESDQAAEMFGDPFMLVSASVLEGYHGIDRVPPQRQIVLIAMEFDGDEVVYANGTVLVHCAAPRLTAEQARGAVNRPQPGDYRRLTDHQGHALVNAMRAEA